MPTTVQSIVMKARSFGGCGVVVFLISGMVPAYGGSVAILHNLYVTVITDMYRVPVHTNRQRPSGSRRNRFARDSFLSGVMRVKRGGEEERFDQNLKLYCYLLYSIPVYISFFYYQNANLVPTERTSNFHRWERCNSK